MKPQTTEAAIPYTITDPAMVNILAPTPRMKPSACGQLGRSVFCRIGSIPFDIAQIIGIYSKQLM